MKIVPVLIGVILLAVGVSAFANPDLLAMGFGIPTDTAASRAYVVATGTRDIAMGCWLLALVWLGSSKRVVAASMFAIALVAAGDAANVYAHSGLRGWLALVGHVGSLGMLLAVGTWLWNRRDA